MKRLMRRTKRFLPVAPVLLVVVGAAMPESVVAAEAAPVMMSSTWAARLCEAWNKDAVLTDELGSSDWIKNDRGAATRFYRWCARIAREVPRQSYAFLPATVRRRVSTAANAKPPPSWILARTTR